MDNTTSRVLAESAQGGATYTFAGGHVIPPSAMAIGFIARCASMSIIRRIPKFILLTLICGGQLVVKFGKSSWLMWSALVLLGCATGIAAPTASACTMKTSSMACLAIPAVANATWADTDKISREVAAARPATNYLACTVEIYNDPGIKRQAVLLDTGAARTPLPRENLWHTLRKHGTKPLKNLLISATGAVHSASE